MHVYYFITPVTNSPGHNAGCSFITYGCKYLIARADPDSVFLDVSITEHSTQSWDLLLDQAQVVVFAGNPRYNNSNVRSYWDYDIWDHLKRARSKGILVADLFGGSACPLPLKPIEDMTAEILLYERNTRTLSFQRELDMVVTRDALAHSVLSTVRDDAYEFPCSSFWAPSYAGVTAGPRPYNCVVLRYIQDCPGVIESLYSLAQVLSREKKTYFLCHAGFEYWWAKKHLPDIKNLICIFDPLSLLKFYSMCDKVISMRLHGSIPALALGCKVINVATDSRCLAFDYFGLSSLPYTELDFLREPLHFSTFLVSDYAYADKFISLFRDKIVGRL